MYGGVKWILKLSTDSKHDILNTEQCQDHIVCSFGYKLIGYKINSIVNLIKLSLVKMLIAKLLND